MRKKPLISTVLAIALCTLTASAGMIGLGGLGVKKSSVLSDLPGVHIKVVLLNSKELEKYSPILTEQYLRNAVETILRKRHINLFSKDELLSVPGKPILEVKLHSAIEKQPSMAAINVRMRLIEEVSLARNDLRARAAIWESSVVILERFESLEIVGEAVERLTISFCDRYDKANPRPGIGTKNQE